MFEVSIDNVPHKVVFQHVNDESIATFFNEEKVHRNGTICLICVPNNDDGWDVVYSSVAALHPQEQSVKNKGRKVALKNALETTDFPAETRRLFWEEYFKVRGRVD